MMQTLNIKIADTNVKITTNFKKYYDYLSVYFKSITNGSADSASVEVEFIWLDDTLSKQIERIKNENKMVAIGSNTLISDHRVVTIRKLERKWKVLFDGTMNKDKFILKAYFQRKPTKDFFRYGPLSKPQDEFYFMLTYHLVYYPLFWFLETFKTIYSLHASALSYQNKGLIICGLEGVGKTSLALKFLQEEGSKFLSDNLVFFNNRQVYPCFELVRMHTSDQDLGLTKGFKKINQFNILKDFYSPTFDILGEGIPADILIFPEFSSDFFVKEMSVEESVNRALALSYLPAELNEYVVYRNLYNLMKDSSPSGEFLYKTLNELLRDCRCYRIGMPKGDGLDENYKKVKEAVA